MYLHWYRYTFLYKNFLNSGLFYTICPEYCNERDAWARNLKFGYFTQHFVDQLDMTVCPVEIMQKEFPGKREMVVTGKKLASQVKNGRPRLKMVVPG
jgi:hypothetical protein